MNHLRIYELVFYSVFAGLLSFRCWKHFLIQRNFWEVSGFLFFLSWSWCCLRWCILKLIFYNTAIVSFRKVTNEQKEEAKKSGVTIYSWDEFIVLVRQPACFVLTCNTSSILFGFCRRLNLFVLSLRKLSRKRNH